MTTTCTFCGSDRITVKVKMYCDSAENFPLRARYKNPKKSMLRPWLPEYFYADMCNVCGSVVRMYAGASHDDWETGDY
jgi:hypothetical protein